MYEVFNMGCGFAVTISAEQAADAISIFDKHHPGTRVIGEVTADSGVVTVPGLGIVGDETGLRGS